jgi:hypothetical protein
MIDYFGDHEDVRKAFPGLLSILQLARGGAVRDETLTRGVLVAIAGHSVFQAARDALEDVLKKDVDDFIDGETAANLFSKREFIIPASPAAKHHFEQMEKAGTDPVSRRWLNAKRQSTPVIYEDEAHTKVMTVCGCMRGTLAVRQRVLISPSRAMSRPPSITGD